MPIISHFPAQPILPDAPYCVHLTESEVRELTDFIGNADVNLRSIPGTVFELYAQLRELALWMKKAAKVSPQD